MRTKILELLAERGIKKSQMARDMDITHQYLNMIIKGQYDGSYKFWRNFKNKYNISDEEIELYKEMR